MSCMLRNACSTRASSPATSVLVFGSMPRMPATNTKSPARVPRLQVPVGLIAPLGAAGLACVVKGGRLEHHQIRRLERHPVCGERVLDRLVLADRAVEDDTLFRVGGGAIDRAAPEPDQLGADQDALGIHAVQDVFEALAFFADAVRFGHRQAV